MTVLPFPLAPAAPRLRLIHSAAARPAPVVDTPVLDTKAIAAIGDAVDHLEAVGLDLEISAANARAGTPLAGLAGLRNGRALAYACRLLLSLIILRGAPMTPADAGLHSAVCQWLVTHGGNDAA